MVRASIMTKREGFENALAPAAILETVVHPKVRMKILSRLMAVALIFTPVLSSGCVNDYKSNHVMAEQSRGLIEDLMSVSLVEPWPERAARLQNEVDQGGDYKAQNDLASALMHTGKASEAIAILERIEVEHPGLYRTASNLGTAYELSGDPVKALEWIRRGIERNPVSHEGSEWIHVRILEAKVAHAHEPNWRPEGSVLGLDFGVGVSLKSPAELPKGNAGTPLTLADIESGLKYQLHERLQFVKAPDALVASLLADYGDIVALKQQNMGVAGHLYEKAQAYLKEDPNVPKAFLERIDARAKEAFRLTHKIPIRASPEPQNWFLLSAITVLGLCGLWALWRWNVRVYRRRMAELSAK